MSARTIPALVTVIIPCFNEEGNVTELHRRLADIMSRLALNAEFLFIDDRSLDRTFEKLTELKAADSRIKVIRFSRNFGHQLALTAGLDRAAGEVVLVIDADLQDPPELLEQMLVKWREGYDVVYAQRTAREGERPLKRFFAYAFYRLIQQITGIEIPLDTGDFRLLDRKAVEAIRQLRERHRFVRGMVSWIGFRQAPVQYLREKRFAGETSYPFRKSLKLAIDAITSFSYMPLRMATWLGLSISAFAFVYILVVLWLKILGVNFYGYTSLMASILLLGGVQLMVLGAIGEYVGRVFEQGQNRPLYIIDELVE